MRRTAPPPARHQSPLRSADAGRWSCRPIGCILAIALTISLAGCKKDAADKPTTTPAQAGGATAAGAGPAPAPGAAASGTDVATNPAALYAPGTTAAQLSFHGVRLGDPKSAIPAADLAGEPDPSGWVGFKGRDNVFRIEEGKVAAMQVADPALLAQLNLKSEQDVVARFGPPSTPAGDDPKDLEAIYTYRDRNLTVTWNRKAGKVAAVNLGG